MNIFSGCLIALELGTNIPYKKKQQLRKTVTDNGGVVSFIITKKCSHLVVDDCKKASDTYKARTALKYGVPVVSLNFIDDCLEAKKLLEADGYIAVGKTKAEEFGSGKIVAKTTSGEKCKRKIVQLNTVRVWKWGDNKAPQFDEKTYEVAKSIVLAKKEKRKDLVVTNFCVLEIHVSPHHSTSGTDDARYRVFQHRGQLGDKDDLGQMEVRFSDTPAGALDLFSQLHKHWTTFPNNLSKIREFLSPRIGSPKFRQMLCDYGMEQGSMSPEVSDLLEHIWQEAIGELDQTLRVPLQDIKADQIVKAEAVLVELKQALNKSGDKSTVERLSDEFYSHLPHKPSRRQPINSKRLIAKKQNLCQLLHDMVAVNEATSWATRSSVEAKYRALRCHIAPLSNDTVEYSEVMSLVKATPKGAEMVSVVNVYAVNRGIEERVFNGNLGNKRLLFHASATKNFVGILSRGLLLPKVVVDDLGGQRTDAGMLGNGIYFADDYSTWSKYSQPSKTKGTRLLVINEVSLGKCADLYKFDTELKAPPDGYSSTHGVRKTESVQSDFQDDEYAIYDTCQQRMRYLVEFTLPGDETKDIVSQSDEQTSESQDLSADVGDIGLEDVKDVVDPQSTVTSGLISVSDSPVPLTSVHVRAKLLDLAAQVVILQAYVNESNEPIEAKYVFPLGEMAVVCGFEAFINGKHVVGEVKEKETAHREYKEALAAGHGAYLMDQHVDLPDVFTVSVGNLPPGASVLIKITYVAELQVDGEKICFFLPSNVAPWSKRKAFGDVTQTGLSTVNVDEEILRDVSIQVAIEMPFDIRSITCPTHRVRSKQTATKATVEMEKNQALDDGFHLLISLAQIHVPRMWVERYPGSDSEACMLTFYPEFDAVSRPDFEVVFLLDLSNSMDGPSLIHAKKLLLLLLYHLPPKCTFNIVTFGTVFDELFPVSQPKTRLNEEAAQRYIQRTRATMGNTEALRPLHSYFLLGGGGPTRNVFLISDGHINAEELTLAAVKDNAPQTRLFTFAVGSTANRHLLRRLAHAGAGAYEVFDAATKYKWEERVTRQLSKAAQPSLSSVSVSWQQFDSDVTPLQAPSHVTALFSGSRQVIYGFVPNCTRAELKAVVDNQEISTNVSTTELNITTGKILHQLTARAAIRDWEEGTLADSRSDHEIVKKNRTNLILQLSTKYSIVTRLTSFVAVEKREKGETFWAARGPSIDELVEQESVDALTYVAWDGEDVKPPTIQYDEGNFEFTAETLEHLTPTAGHFELTSGTYEVTYNSCLDIVSSDDLMGVSAAEVEEVPTASLRRFSDAEVSIRRKTRKEKRKTSSEACASSWVISKESLIEQQHQQQLLASEATYCSLDLSQEQSDSMEMDAQPMAMRAFKIGVKKRAPQASLSSLRTAPPAQMQAPQPLAVPVSPPSPLPQIWQPFAESGPPPEMQELPSYAESLPPKLQVAEPCAFAASPQMQALPFAVPPPPPPQLHAPLQKQSMIGGSAAQYQQWGEMPAMSFGAAPQHSFKSAMSFGAAPQRQPMSAMSFGASPKRPEKEQMSSALFGAAPQHQLVSLSDMSFGAAPQSQEKEQMSAALFGAAPQSQQKEQMSAALFGAAPQSQQKEQMSAALFGAAPQSQQKEQMSAMSFGAPPQHQLVSLSDMSFGAAPQRQEKEQMSAVSFGAPPQRQQTAQLSAMSFGAASQSQLVSEIRAAPRRQLSSLIRIRSHTEVSQHKQQEHTMSPDLFGTAPQHRQKQRAARFMPQKSTSRDFAPGVMRPLSGGGGGGEGMRVDENKISRSSDARMSEEIESAEKQPQPATAMQHDREVCDSPVLPELHTAANSAAAVQIDAGGMDGHQSTLYKAVCRSFAGIRQTAAEYEPKERLLKFRQPSPPPQETWQRLPHRLSESAIEMPVDLTLSSPNSAPMGVYRGTGSELREMSDSIPLAGHCPKSLILTEYIHSASEEEEESDGDSSLDGDDSDAEGLSGEFLSEMLSEADIEYMIDEDMMDIMDLGSLIRNKKGIRLVFRLQSSEGYWTFGGRLEKLLHLHGYAIMRLLMDAGLRSLGEKLTKSILRLACTLKVLQWIMPKEMAPSLTGRPSDLNRELKVARDGLIDVIRETPDEFAALPRSGHEIVDALEYCIGVTSEHPMVFSQLELGGRWMDVIMCTENNVS